MNVPFIDLKPQFRQVRKDTLRAVSRVFKSQHFILGEENRRFEEEAAHYLGTDHAVGLASGTDALVLALQALGIGPGDEVITTPFSFFSTVSSIVRVGARPVFVDIEEDSFNLDPGKIDAKITGRTRAILPAHLFGRACRMDAILKIAKKHSLKVVEDAAQSFGASFGSRRTGAIGDVGCFSFYPTKNLGGAGDGGMIATESGAIADKVRLLRDHGQHKKYRHEEIGTNSRLDEIQAAVLRLKLRHIDRWNQMRQKHAAFYERAFKGLPLTAPKPSGSIHHLYTVRTERRDALAEHLKRKGIGCGVYYPLPLHRQPCFRKLGVSQTPLPAAEKACREVLSLPMFPELKGGQLKAVARAVRDFF